MDIVHVECDPKDVNVERLIWHPGTPYDPPGYYAIIKFKGSINHVFVHRGDKPEED